MLIEPLEDDLPEGCELILVLDSDLYLVPFSMLRGGNNPEFLCERFNLITAPSMTSVKSSRNVNKAGTDDDKTNALVVGNPKLPSSVSDQWGWGDIPQAAQEAETVSEILQATALTGDRATKADILDRISGAECIHLACHVSWKMSAVVLSPGEFVESKSSEGCPSVTATMTKSKYALHNETIHEEEGLDEMKSDDTGSSLDMPSPSEFLLTAADIAKLKLSAKLVVLSSCYDKEETVSSEGLTALTGALLAAGAQCVLVSLWPVPDQAIKLTMKALYSSLLQGSRVSRALAEAMMTVQNTKHFQHPANWAGFTLVSGLYSKYSQHLS
jgi:CHAT domain-containing protein